MNKRHEMFNRTEMINNCHTSFCEEALLFYVGKVEKIKRNYPIGIYTLDAFIERGDEVLAIEYDGAYFHSTDEALGRDSQKAEVCSKAGIRLIRVKEGDSDYTDGDIIYRQGNMADEHLTYAIQAILALLGHAPADIDYQRDALYINSPNTNKNNRRQLLPMPSLDLEDIEWRDVVGFEQCYEVSNYGHVRSKQRKVWNHMGYLILEPRLLKPNVLTKGYLQVTLGTGVSGGRKSKQVHRLVAEAFLPNPDSLPLVNHKNGKKQDNRVDNLEWCGDSDNQLHSYAHGLSRPHFCAGGALKRRKIALLNEDMQVLHVFDSARVAAAYAGTKWPSLISACCKYQSIGIPRFVYGMRFVYLDDVERISHGKIRFPQQRIIRQMTIDGQIIATFPTLRAAARSVGVTDGSIANAVKRGGTSAGYRWQCIYIYRRK